MRMDSSTSTSVHLRRAAEFLDAIGIRVMDVLLAATLLLLLLPVILLTALLIKLESPGPVFFRAERIGYRGQPLRMLKFRKM
jgi:lipopolysaccharide/colanic/teichoic acid biosynthesis glycosyltransferase